VKETEYPEKTYSFLIKVQLYFFNLDAWGVEKILLEFSAELESFHTNRNFRAEEPLFPTM
jgi:hypothetical protein